MEKVLAGPGGRTAKVIVADENEHLQRCWVKGAFYEAGMLNWIHAHYNGGVFVDVGACIGNHALYFAAFCDPELVIAIEPVTTSRKLMRSNLRLNVPMHKVVIAQCAIGSESSTGKMEMFEPQRVRNVGMYKLVKGASVFVKPLDQLLLDELSLDPKEITVVKIDVEFSELEVLRGATRLLREGSPALFIEVAADMTGSILAFLADFDYSPTGKVFNASPSYEFVKKA